MIEIIGLVIILLLSALIGARIDRRDFDRIREAEAGLVDVSVFNGKNPPPQTCLVAYPLVSGSVVVSVSYFKTFIATLHGLFGGGLSLYEGSIEIARREALVRMRRAAKAQGADMVINVRVETSSISKQSSQQSVGAVEVLVYGTAVRSMA